MKKLNTKGSAYLGIIFIVVGIIVIVAGLVVYKTGHKAAPANPNACVTKTFSSGSQGRCISDLQNMVNSQAYGIDGQHYIKITGTYDVPTSTAVKVFQSNFQLPTTGIVTPADWQKLCDSSDPPSNWKTISTDAGCQ